MTGWGAPLVQALTTGAYGTNPVIRWSLTFIPVNDHYTQFNSNPTVSSQNAFGQITSVSIRNRKNDAYITGVGKAASDELPPKYRFRDKK
jgi:hypothetical protein